jgi:hypothetical protein
VVVQTVCLGKCLELCLLNILKEYYFLLFCDLLMKQLKYCGKVIFQ